MPSAPVSPLACIIVHYGDPQITAGCVASLLAGGHVPYIIVVSNTQNAATHTLRHVLNQRVPQASIVDGGSAAPAKNAVLLVSLGANKGFAVACNAGLRLARQKNGIRFVWLLNNDTTVAPHAAERLLFCLERHQRVLCGTSVFRADAVQKLELALGCRFSPLTTMLAPCHAGDLPEHVPGTPRVDYIYGASLAFSCAALEDIGFLDEAFFLYYEEHDFCLRAKKAGYAFHWCRDAAVWHGLAGKSAPPQTQNSMLEFKHYHETRSTMLFLRKHHTMYILPALLFRTLGKVFVLWRRGQLWLLKSYFQGIVAGLWQGNG